MSLKHEIEETVLWFNDCAIIYEKHGHDVKSVNLGPCLGKLLELSKKAGQQDLHLIVDFFKNVVLETHRPMIYSQFLTKKPRHFVESLPRELIPMVEELMQPLDDEKEAEITDLRKQCDETFDDWYNKKREMEETADKMERLKKIQKSEMEEMKHKHSSEMEEMKRKHSSEMVKIQDRLKSAKKEVRRAFKNEQLACRNVDDAEEEMSKKVESKRKKLCMRKAS